MALDCGWARSKGRFRQVGEEQIRADRARLCSPVPSVSPILSCPCFTRSTQHWCCSRSPTLMQLVEDPPQGSGRRVSRLIPMTEVMVLMAVMPSHPAASAACAGSVMSVGASGRRAGRGGAGGGGLSVGSGCCGLQSTAQLSKRCAAVPTQRMAAPCSTPQAASRLDVWQPGPG